ncbi:Spx/MgsR family RNA polymerase-binding regulatory protein [Facklamia miroungae]|uniref:Arsenate reductase n=1 Tax=Facklamia miroungae TaxID=120956 RepID=A0A1G7QML9_9LACT|nr:Spx/MgsR family RNA polymerase-binding regulatory protein [Facklamia miroungae]NKZ28996.1 Spx/MgsR family RNA polymerase-binding regulatory protein [Facklamia miroungae]SDF99746.1 arsenate reductase [Facklamia miroungae]
MLKIYGLKQCSTCQKVIKLMQSEGFELSPMIDIRQEPPTIEELERVYQSYEGHIRKMLNTSGQAYRDLNLKNRLEDLSKDEVFTLMLEDGMLIKRPLILDNEKGSAGSNIKQLKQIWSI